MTAFLYNFGISQDDARTERQALDLRSGDRLICLASAGELPLNLLACYDIHIDAVDISQPQLFLSRIKMIAATHLDPVEAASFIGYMKCEKEQRIRWFRSISSSLNDSEKTFWQQHPEALFKGPVHAARFERYISRFNWLALGIIGKKRLGRLFDLNDIAQQKQYFDRYIDSSRLKLIFRTVFHPRIYKNRGMDEKGMTHSGERNIADFFFSRFRDFCTSTPARKNLYLQFSFFNRILFEEAFPDYLHETGNQLLRDRLDRLSFHHESVSGRIGNSQMGFYNKFALSNLTDWLSDKEMTELLQLVARQSSGQGRVLLRYIHHGYSIPEDLKSILRIDESLSHELLSKDRYPFYSLIPITLTKTT